MTVSRPGSTPPVPEPFWNRSWRTFWRWRPECVYDGERFSTQDAFNEHWLVAHARPISRDITSSQEAPKA